MEVPFKSMIIKIDRAVCAQYRAQLMQRLSTCLVQFSYQRCVLRRARLALPWRAPSSQAGGGEPAA